MAQFRTTRVVSPGSTNIPLFWFVQSDDEQRASTEAALKALVDQIVTESSQLEKKNIVSVPWLRNYAASAADVFATACNFEMGEGHILGIDKQSFEDKTLLVFHCRNGQKPELGRAGRKEAIEVLLKERLYMYTLAELFDGRAWTAIPVLEQDLEPITETNDEIHTLPAHIPKDLKLREDRIVLFSLINLTQEEISVLKQDMGDTANDITIFNWPHAVSASQAEIYNIFQCVKPDIPVPHGQTFVLFVDAAHLSGPQRAPLVVVACESAADSNVIHDGSRPSKLYQMQLCHISLRAEYAQAVKELWHLIWHPPDRGSVNGVVVNYPLFYGTKHHFYDSAASATVDWEHPVARYGVQFIAKPGLAVEAIGARSPDYVVFILCPVTPEEIRTLRNILQISENTPMLVELNITPRLTEAASKQQKSVKNSGTRLDPLLAFFDTPACRLVADPPEVFVFLDNEALNILLAGVGEDLSVPVTTTCRYCHYHGERLIAVEKPGYQFADIVLDEGLQSTLANLSVGNMWFWEIVGCYSDDLDVAFWPEYRGSMTKEMLDIEWDWS
ncbi:hypothetical protein OPT61_g3230 [Boeremia exigua]|uniref:Uncharacterized protein n=1 Tax=Boeremia exigua TaxID=749465 RepID=A0ACC2IIH8_9PLEO|nr:hypothetical protein OPT61_g3230 [Boeremia exigua]